jgi:cytoskeletal protein RodZ
MDLPTDDGPANPPAAPTSGPGKWLNRGFIIAAVAIVFIYFFNNRKQTITSNDRPTITAPVTTPNNNDNPVRNNSPGTTNTQTPQNNTSAPANASTVLPVDSNAIAPVTGPVLLQPDTAAVKTNAAPVFTPPVVTPQKNNAPDSTKKGRGVKGITDADYKIVPKKDSSKN